VWQRAVDEQIGKGHRRGIFYLHAPFFGPESDAIVGVIEKLLEHPGDEEVITFAREMLSDANRMGFRYPPAYRSPRDDPYDAA
jgi:hypothetical protein